MNSFRLFWLLPLIAALLSSCTSNTGSLSAGRNFAHAEAAKVGSAQRVATPAPVESRPGLGTKWGENRRSEVRAREFSRGSRTTPWATAKFFYNDEEGAKAMANATGFAWRRTGPFETARGTLDVGLKKGGGGFLRSFSADGDRFFVGEMGDRYSIWIKNKTKSTLEVVVSVDGLDVLDGKPASYKRRGYLVHPGRALTIDGFREDSDTVAAFRFSSVADSYAQRRHGNARNVGVVGIAVFPEDGRNPFDEPVDSRRLNADPFPREFAKPPE